MKLSDLLGNISGIAAFAIIVAGVGGFFVALIASVIGRPLDAQTAALVNTFIQILIGLAVGARAAAAAANSYKPRTCIAAFASSWLNTETSLAAIL